MIKVYIFNKSNNVSRVYDVKKFFQCIDSEISLAYCTDMSTVYLFLRSTSMANE